MGFHYWKIGLILTLALLVVAGCRQEPATSSETSLQIELEVEPDSPEVGNATLLVTLTDNDQPVDDATVTARGDMSHAGMVPVIEAAEGGTDGVYEIPFSWTMAGDWTVEVTVELPSGTTASETFDFSVEGEEMDMDSTEEAGMGDMEMPATPTLEVAE